MRKLTIALYPFDELSVRVQSRLIRDAQAWAWHGGNLDMSATEARDQIRALNLEYLANGDSFPAIIG